MSVLISDLRQTDREREREKQKERIFSSTESLRSTGRERVVLHTHAKTIELRLISFHPSHPSPGHEDLDPGRGRWGTDRVRASQRRDNSLLLPLRDPECLSHPSRFQWYTLHFRKDIGFATEGPPSGVPRRRDRGTLPYESLTGCKGNDVFPWTLVYYLKNKIQKKRD